MKEGPSASLLYLRKGVDLEEIWKPIDGFPGYMISNAGDVYSKKNNKLLDLHDNGLGYYQARLYKDGACVAKRVNRLVAEAFIDNPENKPFVNHIDGNKHNNNVINLEWATASENTRHAFDTGLHMPSGGKQKKRVRIIETGEIFDSITECADAINGFESAISNVLREDKPNYTHQGFHFELIDDDSVGLLYSHQLKAVKKMHNGCILNGSVGSGKSRAALSYYCLCCGARITNDKISLMKDPIDLYIITTAKKRDSKEWIGEMIPFLLNTDKKLSAYNNNIVVDSWQNIQKYVDVKNAFFILDEDHLTGTGAWVKAFWKIARNNQWIVLSATPGDQWSDYGPVFVANGFYKNITEFRNRHFQYRDCGNFRKIERVFEVRRLERLRDKILVDMEVDRHTTQIHNDIWVNYDRELYRSIMRDKWNPWTDEPIKNASEYCYALRRAVNNNSQRDVAVLEVMDKSPRAIIFYNFDYERDRLLELFEANDIVVHEWNSHKHQEIPDGDRWAYICQYNACEGWNCIKTDTIIFYSQTYSWKTLVQACGRIDRLNTPYKELYFWHLKTRSSIDLGINRALKAKKKFNESRFSGGL